MSRLPRWSSWAPALAVSALVPCRRACAQDGDKAAAPRASVQQVLLVGTVHPVSGPAFGDGAIVIGDGRIVAVGPRAEVAVPEGATVVSLPTAHAYPGLVDAWSRAFVPAAGLGEGGAGTDVLAGLDRFAADGRACVRAGITTAHVLSVASGKWPGTGILIRPAMDGFTSFANGRSGAELLRLTGDPNQHPVARYKDLLDLGRVFEEAEAYGKARSKHAEALAKYEQDWAAYLEALRKGGKPEAGAKEAKPAEGAPAGEAAAPPSGPKRPTFPKEPPRDPQKDALLRVAAGEVRLWIEAQRRQELRAALALLQEQKVRHAALLGALDGAACLQEIADAGVGVVLTPTGVPAELDGDTVGVNLAHALHDKGVPFAVASGSAKRCGELSLLAATCVGEGVPEDVAVRAITLTPAELLGIAADVGSLERGKRADIVLVSAPLLKSETRVLRVLADGRTVYQGR